MQAQYILRRSTYRQQRALKAFTPWTLHATLNHLYAADGWKNFPSNDIMTPGYLIIEKNSSKKCVFSLPSQELLLPYGSKGNTAATPAMTMYNAAQIYIGTAVPV